MVAMPYILVNIVLDQLSLLLFCVTSAALLSRYPAASLYLPAPVRNRRALALLARALLLALLSIGVVRVARVMDMYDVSRFLREAYFYIGFVNSVVLGYQFLDTRYFLAMPRVPRRLVMALCSVVMTSVAVVAVVATVTIALVIR